MQDRIKTAETTFTLAWHGGNKQYFISWCCANMGGIVRFYDSLEDAERAFALLTPIGV